MPIRLPRDSFFFLTLKKGNGFVSDDFKIRVYKNLLKRFIKWVRDVAYFTTSCSFDFLTLGERERERERDGEREREREREREAY